MPERFFSFGAAYNRERGQGVGLAPRSGITERRTGTVVGVAAPDTFGVLFFLPGEECVDVVDVEALITGAAGTFEFRAALGDPAWLVTNLTTGLTTSLTNGGSATIELAVALVLGGPPVPFPAIRLNGAALAVLGAGPFSSSRILYRVREFGAEQHISHERAGSFQNSPIAIELIPAAIASLELLFGQVGARAQIGTSTSVPTARNFVDECSVALPHPCAFVWVGPTDIGNAPDQIPATIAENSAAHYFYHPASFYREPQYVRVVQAEDAAPWRLILNQEERLVPAPVTTPQGALTILQVIVAPTHSRWILTIDGVEFDVILAHPVGSDLRKPVDIYEAVIAPAVWANNATGSPLPTFRRDPTNAAVFNQVGLQNKMQFLDHALFVEPLCANLTMTEVFYQTGAIVPPAP